MAGSSRHRSWKVDGTIQADIAAAMGVADLHETVVADVVKAISTGIAVEALDGMVSAVGAPLGGLIRDRREERRELLAARVDEERRKAARARRNANEAGDDELAAAFLDDARAALDRRRRFERELADLDQATDSARFGDVFESECDFLARSLAAVAVADSKVPAEVNSALRRIMECTPVAMDEHWVTLETFVKVPANGMVARLGPVHSRVRNRAYWKPHRDEPRHLRVAEAILAEGRTLEEEREARGHNSPAAVRRELVAAFRDAGLGVPAARTLSHCTVPAVAATIWAHLGGRPLPEDVPEGLARHLVATYTDPGFRWTPAWWAGDCRRRQRALNLVAEAGGSMDKVLLEQRGEFPSSYTTRYTKEYVTNAGYSCPPILERSGDWTVGKKAGRAVVRLVDCPHCGGWASKSLWVPETPRGLLCPDCLRMPVEGSPVFLQDYLEV